MCIENGYGGAGMGRAILTVCYGVRSSEEMERSVVPVRKAIETAFPECTVCHTLACDGTADFVKASGAAAFTFGEGLSAMKGHGFEDIRIVPLLLTSGRVYDDLQPMADGYPMGRPLLDGEEDLARVADIYGRIAAREGCDVLLMGHGSLRAGGDRPYIRLKERLPDGVHLACRSGALRLEDVIPKLRKDRKLILMPLMVAAGSHVRKEMAGDGADSWQRILRSMGFDVGSRLEGMGSMPEVWAMFVEKARCLMAQE